MPRRNERLDDEIRFHIEQQTSKNIQAGMSPEEARRAAIVKFGGIERAREAARDEVRFSWLADFLRDLRMSVRSLRRTPRFAVAVAATLALGLGAAIAMFSVVNRVLLQPLPYPDADRIVRLYQLNSQGGRSNVSGPNFEDWRNGTRSFTEMALWQNWGRSPAVGLGDPRRVPTIRVTARFFRAFAAQPQRGRAFGPDDFSGVAQTAILSAGLAARIEDGDPLNRTFTLDGAPLTVVGVMPRDFDYPVGTDIWLPLNENEAVTRSRSSGNFQAIARLADGVSLDQARAEIGELGRVLKARYRDDTPAAGADALPILDVMTGPSRTNLMTLLSASVLLLMVAVLNVSNMLVARGMSRRRELAVQLALGAGYGRIARQVIAETLTLCACGAALAFAFAATALRVFVAMAPAGTPRLQEIGVDWTSASAAALATLAVSVVLALVTVATMRTRQPASGLSDGTRGGSSSRRQVRLREALIVVEVALTLILLAGGGLMARTLARVLAIDPGFNIDSALIVDLTMSSDGEDGLARRVARQTEIVARLRTLPGVEHVGLVSSFPIGPGFFNNGTFVEMTRVDEFTSRDQIRALGPAVKPRQGDAGYRLANGDYFKAMGIPLRRGRLIEDSDGPGMPHVAVISESLAAAKWPGQDPIGRYVQFGNMDGDVTGIRIVGVVGDVREIAIEATPPPILYASYSQRPRQAATCAIVVRGPDPVATAGVVRRVIREIAPDAPVEIRTTDAAIDSVISTRRFNLWLVGAFAVAALVLSAIGVYGLVSFMVEQRLREMGIRLALGAQPGALVRLVVRRGLLLSVAGAGLGLAAALALTRLVSGMLFGITAGDPGVHATGVAVMVVVAASASYLPARRILRQSPAVTLRAG